MKNGLLVYSNKSEYVNIGDYIQSLAARQYFEKIDFFVCRENLLQYSDEEIKLILNGWFTHEPDNWPPSSLIHPLFVSFHINSVAQEKLTSEKSIAYLKKHSPIGCRDYNTVNLLKKHGVDAYFTGCLTLTLGVKYKRKALGNDIYFVDPYFKYYKDASSLASYFKLLLFNYSLISKISLNMFGSISMRNLLKSAAFYKCYSKLFSDGVLMNAIYIVQEMKNSEIDGDEAKFELAEKLLQRYSSAKFVVTSRIHCALPCLGIGTPVLYVENQQQAETSLCRLDGLRDLFHLIKCDGSILNCEIMDKKITQDFLFTNKPGYKLLVDKLIQTCSNFVGDQDKV